VLEGVEEWRVKTHDSEIHLSLLAGDFACVIFLVFLLLQVFELVVGRVVIYRGILGVEKWEFLERCRNRRDFPGVSAGYTSWV
jgi:hypothetical protein